MNICESNHSRSRDARALHGHNKKYFSQIPRESAGFKVAQSENFGLKAYFAGKDTRAPRIKVTSKGVALDHVRAVSERNESWGIPESGLL
jgi:hypothetical protein